jgi:hypothetical protein
VPIIANWGDLRGARVAIFLPGLISVLLYLVPSPDCEPLLFCALHSHKKTPPGGWGLSRESFLPIGPLRSANWVQYRVSQPAQSVPICSISRDTSFQPNGTAAVSPAVPARSLASGPTTQGHRCLSSTAQPSKPSYLQPGRSAHD